MEDYMLQPGDKLDGCCIKKSLGRGGFAEVYLAECESLGEVALKLYTDPSLDYKDFFNEVKAMGLFNHKPYFVSFRGASDIGSHYQYILMEYMKGGNLRERMGRVGKVSIDEALWIIFLITYALRDMHEMGILHRDVAPDNIFFDERDNPKLGDLGFAATREQLRQAPFKQYYTAPEIFEGEDYSSASDIYSLGVSLYEMLGGDLRKGNIYEGIRFLDVPHHLMEILEGMCKRESGQRSSASKLIEDLSKHITPQSFTTYVTTESPEPRVEDIEVILTRTFFHQERERAFLERWMKKKEEILKGLKDDLQWIISRSLYFAWIPLEGGARKRSNCYIGVEHLLWGLLEKEALLDVTLSKFGLSTEEMRKEIFSYLSRIEYIPVERVISPRLEELLKKAKNQFPEGVGEREFITLLLGEDTFFYHILRARGLDREAIKKEVEE